MSKRTDYEEKTASFVQPILDQEGFSLYDVEYVREGSEYFLRVYIDKPGGVTIDDCVTVSRAMNEILDREDYIDEEYTFEVSSPGIERRLRTDAHFHAAVGEWIRVKLFRPVDGEKELLGELRSFDDDTLVLETDSKELTLLRDAVSMARMAYMEE